MNPVKMPTLFIGHGSPMNAVEQNEFTKALVDLGSRLPRPRAILCVSAHWMTQGSWVTAMERPKTIHDFYGFPEELFQIEYPAPGDPELAQEIARQIVWPKISLDESSWGLDHGSWAVLRYLFPRADIPVLQFSLDINMPPDHHFNIGKALGSLREQGIMLFASGNIVHNLRQINWRPEARSHSWAIEFDQWVQDKLQSRDFQSLVKDWDKTEAGRLSVPTPDHYYPLLYVLGAVDAEEPLQIEYQGMQNASISMLSFSFGRV